MRTKLIGTWLSIALFAGAAALGKDCHCDSAKPKARATASEAATQSALNSMVKQKFADAEKSARDGMRLARTPFDKARALGVLGWALGEQKKYDEGASAYKEGLELRKRYAKTAREIEETAVQMQQLASLYQKAGQKERAIKILNEAALEMDRAHGKGHPLSKLAHEMADAARK